MSVQEDSFSETDNSIYDNRDPMMSRIIEAWVDMRTSSRRLINENPDESRLIFMIVLSDLVFFLSWSIKTLVAPMSSAQHLIPVEISIWLVGALMVRTACMYIFSLIVFWCCKLFKGKGSWYETRICVFWAALISAPFGLIAALATVGMYGLEDYFPIFREEWISLPPYWLGIIPFVWFVSCGISEAHKFKNNSPAFMAMSVLSLAGLVGLFYMKATGHI